MHWLTTAVTSAAKTSERGPASALPSTYSSVPELAMSASGRSEPLGLDAPWVVSQRLNDVRDRLDEAGRAADEALRFEVRWPRGRADICHAEPSRRARNPLGRRPGVEDRDVQAWLGPAQLVGIERLRGCPHRVEQAERRTAVRLAAGP